MGTSSQGGSHRLAVALLASLLLMGSTGTSLASESMPGYGVRPAPAGDLERPGGVISHGLEAGTGVTDAIEIFNFTGEAALFDVYAADLVESTGDGVTAAPRSAGVTGAGSWLEPEVGTLEIAAHDSARVEFTLDVPPGTAPGSNGAALLVEPQLTNEGTGNIRARTRVAIRVEVEVLGEIDLGVGLGDLTVVRDSRGIRFDLTATNTGTVTFVAIGTVDITDEDGDSLTDVALEPSGLFVSPGDGIAMEGFWEDPPFFGRYSAQAVVEATVGERVPVRYLTETVTFWLIPWTEIAFAVLVVALLAWILYVTRERRAQWAQNRREERALLRDFRDRRKHGDDRTSREPRHRAPAR